MPEGTGITCSPCIEAVQKIMLATVGKLDEAREALNAAEEAIRHELNIAAVHSIEDGALRSHASMSALEMQDMTERFQKLLALARGEG